MNEPPFNSGCFLHQQFAVTIGSITVRCHPDGGVDMLWSNQA
jgi:hypothetical protein